jgi:hypothetical protein
VLDNVSARASDIDKIQLGSLELSLKVSDLPLADPETAKAIVQLDRDGLIELLNISHETSSGSGGRCYRDPIDKDRDYIIDKRLSDTGLITIVMQTSPTPEWCKHGSDLALTALGNKVKDYLVALLTAQIRKSGYSG